MAETVLFISHEASRTGAPIVLLNVLRWLKRNEKISFRIVTGSAGELSPEFAALGKLESVEPSGAAWYRAMRRLDLHHAWQSSHLRRLQNDLASDRIGLVYVNSVASGRMLDLIPNGDCAVICHVHELAGAIRAVGLDNLAALERRRPWYIAVSHAVKDCLVNEFAIAPDRVEVIHGFVPKLPNGTPEAREARRALGRELSIPPEATVVCGCGSIEARKGTDLFIDVARLVTAERGSPKTHFVWVGGAPDRVSEMRRAAVESGLEGIVHFVGHKAVSAPYLAACDVFLLTSREDPFPLVVLEAARCGKPVVCFRDGGGAPEFVDPDAGRCVPDLDVAAMSRHVSELLSSQSLRDQLGDAGRRKVEIAHGLEDGASQIAMRIRQALAMRDGAGPPGAPDLRRGGQAHVVG